MVRTSGPTRNALFEVEARDKEAKGCSVALRVPAALSLKEKLCRAARDGEDECYLEVKDAMKNAEKELHLGTREDHFEGRKKIAEAK